MKTLRPSTRSTRSHAITSVPTDSGFLRIPQHTDHNLSLTPAMLRHGVGWESGLVCVPVIDGEVRREAIA